MNDSDKRSDAASVVAGVLVTALGVVFLLDQLHVADFGHLIGTYWPLIIVGVGLPKIVRPETVWAGLWFVSIGAWLQAVQLHLYGLTFRNSWPLLLIVYGTGIVLRTLFASLWRREPADVEERHGS